MYSICGERRGHATRAIAPRQRALGLRLAVNQTVVDAESARQYPELRELLRPLGVRNQVVVAYEASATYSLRRESDEAPRAPGSFTTFGSIGEAELGSGFDASNVCATDPDPIVRLRIRALHPFWRISRFGGPSSPPDG